MSATNPYAAPIADINAPLAPVADSLQPAARLARFWATLLDGLVYIAPLALLIVAAVAVGAAGKRSGGKPFDGLVIALLVVAGLAFLGVLAFQAYRLATTGQTLGKKWLGIRIVKMDGSPVNFSTAVMLRGVLPWLLGGVPYLGVVFSLVNHLFIFRDDRRCIHDLIAGTRVVDAPAE
jgi:uncharacterized RDD family membrane protein YckC